MVTKPTSDTIVIYRLAQLPKYLSAKLPKDAGPRDCLFWIAKADAPALDAALEAIAEPDIDHVDEAMDIAGEVVCWLKAQAAIPAALGTDTTYSTGFHTAPADEVETWLRDAGHTLIPVADLLSVGNKRPPANKKPAKRRKKGRSLSADDHELLNAACRGDLEAVTAALANGAEVEASDGTTGYTALHHAVDVGDLKMVELLLERGADVNVSMKNAKKPPLGNAVDTANVDIARRLLKAGARTDLLYGRLGHSALHNAISHEDREMVACLLEHGADVNASTKGGGNALCIAVQGGHDPEQAAISGALILQLRRAGADPKASNDKWESALEIARDRRSHLIDVLTDPL